MSINSINGTNPGPTPPVPKTETAPGTETAQALQAGQQEETAQVQQTASRRPSPSPQAFQVALETFITTELEQLSQKVANQTALLKSLPPEIRKVVEQLLNQTQAAQTALPEGLATLLKSPKTAAEKLQMLAAIIKKTSGLLTTDGEGAASSPATAGKPQVLSQLAAAWREQGPAQLKEAAAVLRGLAGELETQQPSAEAGEVPAAMPRPQAGTAQEANRPAQEPNHAASQLQQGKAAQALSQALPGQSSAPAPQAAQPESLPVPAKQPALPPDSAAKPTPPAGQSEQMQNLAQVIKTLAGNPEVVETLPPAVKELVLSIAQQTETSPAGQPTTSQPAQAQPPAQTALSQQSPTPAQTPGPTPPQNPQSAEAGQKSEPGQPMAQSQPQPSAPPTELEQALPAVFKQWPSAGKMAPPAAETLTQLAILMEQAAEQLLPEPRAAQPLTARQQQVLTETAELWRDQRPEELKTAIKVVQELAETMTKPGGVTAERQDNQKVLSFTVPLYFGEGQSVYPAHIHVYHQEQEDKKNPGRKVTETWLRICLETENIGVVETAFRLYDEHNLDVKVRFTDSQAAAGFAGHVEEVKQQLGQLPLTLGEFLVK